MCGLVVGWGGVEPPGETWENRRTDETPVQITPPGRHPSKPVGFWIHIFGLMPVLTGRTVPKRPDFDMMGEPSINLHVGCDARGGMHNYSPVYIYKLHQIINPPLHFV